MIILIEGCDNTGKTTLARAFEDIGFHYVHNGAPGDLDLFAEYGYQLFRAAMGPFRDVVIDRLYLSEYVYGNALRGESRLSLKQVDVLTDSLTQLGGRVVLCSAPWDRVKALWVERLNKEYVQDEGKLREVFLGYESMARLMEGRPWFHKYDFTRYDGRPGQFVREVAW